MHGVGTASIQRVAQSHVFFGFSDGFPSPNASMLAHGSRHTYALIEHLTALAHPSTRGPVTPHVDVGACFDMIARPNLFPQSRAGAMRRRHALQVLVNVASRLVLESDEPWAPLLDAALVAVDAEFPVDRFVHGPFFHRVSARLQQALRSREPRSIATLPNGYRSTRLHESIGLSGLHTLTPDLRAYLLQAPSSALRTVGMRHRPRTAEWDSLFASLMAELRRRVLTDRKDGPERCVTLGAFADIASTIDARRRPPGPLPAPNPLDDQLLAAITECIRSHAPRRACSPDDRCGVQRVIAWATRNDRWESRQFATLFELGRPYARRDRDNMGVHWADCVWNMFSSPRCPGDAAIVAAADLDRREWKAAEPALVRNRDVRQLPALRARFARSKNAYVHAILAADEPRRTLRSRLKCVIQLDPDYYAFSAIQSRGAEALAVLRHPDLAPLLRAEDALTRSEAIMLLRGIGPSSAR